MNSSHFDPQKYKLNNLTHTERHSPECMVQWLSDDQRLPRGYYWTLIELWRTVFSYYFNLHVFSSKNKFGSNFPSNILPINHLYCLIFWLLSFQWHTLWAKLYQVVSIINDCAINIPLDQHRANQTTVRSTTVRRCTMVRFIWNWSDKI